MSDAAPAQGHNRPPPKPFRETLEEKNADLMGQLAALEIESLDLPDPAESDADVAKITNWVVRARALYKLVEARRRDTKQPYLDREREIDEWFGESKDLLTKQAKDVEGRSTAYLLAKQAAEKARADAEAAARRAAAAKAADEARQAAEAARAAREARERAERETREAAEREARERAAAGPAEAPAPPPSAANLGAAAREEQIAEARAEVAVQAAAAAEIQADRAERVAETGGDVRVGGDAGNARVKMVWVGKITSFPKLLAANPLCQWMNETAVQAAVDRAARAETRPTFPGVEFVQVPEVKTTAKRI